MPSPPREVHPSQDQWQVSARTNAHPNPGALLCCNVTSHEFLFIPAESYEEATSRVYGLTGGAAPSTSPGQARGTRAALSSLAEALSVHLDPSWTAAKSARTIADRLGVDWSKEFVHKTSVTLDGVNHLLEAATTAAQSGQLTRVPVNPDSPFGGSAWVDFVPAKSKIEAVTRIAAITRSPREWLGPGSKEHKSAILNLAYGLFPADPHIDTSTKHKLAASLARRLEIAWSDSYVATGQTIKLVGLNVLLAGSERYTGRLGETISQVVTNPADEGFALAAALFAQLPRRWEGKAAIEWLSRERLRGENDTEWQGFYGEERAKRILNQAFTSASRQPRRRYGSTVFDYGLNYVWDVKVHVSGVITPNGYRNTRPIALLNSEQAIRDCVAEQGVGFLVISGDAEMDFDGTFKMWHDRRKEGRSRRSIARSNSGRSRIRKVAFTPTRVDALWVPNTLALDAYEVANVMKAAAQGRQAPTGNQVEGARRQPKFSLNLRNVDETLSVARFEWTPGEFTLSQG